MRGKQQEIDKRNSRARIGDLPHSPEYYHHLQMEAIEELTALILKTTAIK